MRIKGEAKKKSIPAGASREARAKPPQPDVTPVNETEENPEFEVGAVSSTVVAAAPEPPLEILSEPLEEMAPDLPSPALTNTAPPMAVVSPSPLPVALAGIGQEFRAPQFSPNLYDAFRPKASVQSRGPVEPVVEQPVKAETAAEEHLRLRSKSLPSPAVAVAALEAWSALSSRRKPERGR